MLIELGNESKLIDSATPGYNSCGCGNRRYYTKAEIDEMLAGFLDGDKLKEVLNQIFTEYIEEGDLEQLIIDSIAGMYTNEEIDDLLEELEARIKTWTEEQGYLKDINLTINGRLLHNNGSITIKGGDADLSNYYTKSESDNRYLREHQDLSDYATQEWVEGKDYPTKPWVNDQINNGVAGLVKSVDYNTSGQTIDFYDKDNNLVDSIDASVFITDGIISDVYTTGSTLVIVFDVQGEEREITVDFSDIFNPDNYYSKDQVDNKFAAETARTENAYMKGDAIPYYISNHFVTANTEANVITVRMKYPQTGEVQDYTRYIKRINGTNLVTGTKQDDISLPTYEDFAAIVDRLAALEARVTYIEDNCCGGGEEPAERGTFVAIYNVTSTSQPTKILAPEGISGFERAALEDNTTIPLATGYTFSQTGLQKVYYTIGNTLKAKSFWECTQLKQIIIPSGVQTIGADAFNGCSAMTGVTIPSTVTTIGASAFRRCYTLKSVSIPNTVSSIGEYAFAYCKAMTSATLPTGLTAIEQGLFHSATTLASITIPSTVTRISGSAFYACSGLTGTLTIPNAVTVIGAQAFSYCTNLSRIVIGTGISLINPQAFYNCSGLSRITINAGTVPSLAAPTGDPARGVFDSTNNAPIYVPSTSVNAYKAADNWNNYSARIRS